MSVQVRQGVNKQKSPPLRNRLIGGWRFNGFQARQNHLFGQTVNARFSQPTFGIGRKGCTVSKVRKANSILFALFTGIKIEYVYKSEPPNISL